MEDTQDSIYHATLGAEYEIRVNSMLEKSMRYKDEFNEELRRCAEARLISVFYGSIREQLLLQQRDIYDGRWKSVLTRNVEIAEAIRS